LQALLPRDEGKSRAEFQQKLLHLSQDRVFQIALQIAVVQSEKIEYVRIFEDDLGRERLGFLQLRKFMPDHIGGLSRKCTALEQHRLDAFV